jgi:hypothetical protein
VFDLLSLVLGGRRGDNSALSTYFSPGLSSAMVKVAFDLPDVQGQYFILICMSTSDAVPVVIYLTFDQSSYCLAINSKDGKRAAKKDDQGHQGADRYGLPQG